jgi:hypothetical protein
MLNGTGGRSIEQLMEDAAEQDHTRADAITAIGQSPKKGLAVLGTFGAGVMVPFALLSDGLYGGHDAQDWVFDNMMVAKDLGNEADARMSNSTLMGGVIYGAGSYAFSGGPLGGLAAHGFSDSMNLSSLGVGPRIAISAGLATALFDAAGARFGGGVGNTIFKRIATASGKNVAVAAAGNATKKAIFTVGGQAQLADQQPVLDLTTLVGAVAAPVLHEAKPAFTAAAGAGRQKAGELASVVGGKTGDIVQALQDKAAPLAQAGRALVGSSADKLGTAMSATGSTLAATGKAGVLLLGHGVRQVQVSAAEVADLMRSAPPLVRSLMTTLNLRQHIAEAAPTAPAKIADTVNHANLYRQALTSLLTDHAEPMPAPPPVELAPAHQALQQATQAAAQPASDMATLYRLEFHGLTAQRIIPGNNGKIAVIGRLMGTDEQPGVRHYGKGLSDSGYDVELFDGKNIPDGALDEFRYEAAKVKEAADAGRRADKYLTLEELKDTALYQGNFAWASKLKDQGYTVVDIGNPHGIDDSHFYNLEIQTLFGGDDQ